MKISICVVILTGILLSSCDHFIDTVNGCYLTLPDDLGSYEIKQIPDYSVNVGDTIWIAMNDYFKAYDRCDDGYGNFYMEIVDLEYDIAHFSQSERYFVISADKIGETKVDFRGSVNLRRNANDIRRTEFGSFNLEIVESGADQMIKPQSALSPFFSIDSVNIEKDIRSVGTFLETKFFFDNGYFNDEYYSVYIFWDEDGSGSIANYVDTNAGGTDRYGPSFRWDSLTSNKIINLRRSNRATWIPETESYQEGISSYVQSFLKIESYPNDKPVLERQFRVIGY